MNVMGDQRQLADLVNRLDGTTTQRWLRSELATLSTETDRPSVLQVVSSPRSAARILPTGLCQDESWGLLAPNSSSDVIVQQVERADLIVWIMSALKVFPGEYAAVLSLAIEQRIPIWAVMVGIEQLADRTAFTSSLEKHQTRLADGSDLFLVERDTSSEITSRLRNRLAQDGQRIAATGHQRRHDRTSIRCRRRLSEEREEAVALMEKASQRLEIVQAGLASAEILSKNAVDDIRVTYQQLESTVESLRNDLTGFLEVEAREQTSERLNKQIRSKISKWRKRALENAIKQSKELAQDGVTRWVGRLASDLLTLADLCGDQADRAENPNLQPATLLRKIDPALGGIAEDIRGSAIEMEQSMNQDAIQRLLETLGRELGRPRPSRREREDESAAERKGTTEQTTSRESRAAEPKGTTEQTKSREARAAKQSRTPEQIRRTLECNRLCEIVGRACDTLAQAIRAHANRRSDVLIDIAQQVVTDAGAGLIKRVDADVKSHQDRLGVITAAERWLAVEQ